MKHEEAVRTRDAVPVPQGKSILREYAEALIIAVLLALVIRTFVVQAFKIPSGSMLPTLQIGDHILVSKFLYYFQPIRRGEVIVFKFPQDESRDFIKRVIGLPGETLEIRGKQVLINGKPLDEPYAVVGSATGRPGAARPDRHPSRSPVHDGGQSRPQYGQPHLGIPGHAEGQGQGVHRLLLGQDRRHSLHVCPPERLLCPVASLHDSLESSRGLGPLMKSEQSAVSFQLAGVLTTLGCLSIFALS